ncbi:MAG: hypothetical protein ABIT83_12100 [Massilia sp.]
MKPLTALMNSAELPASRPGTAVSVIKRDVKSETAAGRRQPIDTPQTHTK